MKMKMINKNENENDNDIKQYSNGGYQDSFVLFYFIFFYERYFKCKKHKQKHLSNIQPDISKQKIT